MICIMPGPRRRTPLLVGFALTQHCNLRCPHCIRDDVTTVQSLDPALVFRVCEDAQALFGEVGASFTGGEPTLHSAWDEIVSGLAARGVTYRLVTNGWHMRRLMPSIDRWPPAYVRLSLSGATQDTHDGDRGRDSFRRVLIAVSLLTSRQVPTALSIVIDRRNRHEVRAAAELAESLGCLRLHYILPQPVPGSVARDSDIAPSEWTAVREEIAQISSDPDRRTGLALDYGAPAAPGEPEALCESMALKRIYVDAFGRLSLCCQLSEYGFSTGDVVADLHETSLADVWAAYLDGMRRLRAATAPEQFRGELAAFPCMRCAHSMGKLAWLARSSPGPWQALATCG